MVYHILSNTIRRESNEFRKKLAFTAVLEGALPLPPAVRPGAFRHETPLTKAAIMCEMRGGSVGSFRAR